MAIPAMDLLRPAPWRTTVRQSSISATMTAPIPSLHLLTKPTSQERRRPSPPYRQRRFYLPLTYSCRP